METITVETEQLPKYYMLDFSGHPSSRMLTTTYFAVVGGGQISRRNEMSLQNIIDVEVFDYWGIDFVGPLPSLYKNVYILVVVDYVSKWVEAIATPRMYTSS